MHVCTTPPLTHTLSDNRKHTRTLTGPPSVCTALHSPTSLPSVRFPYSLPIWPKSFARSGDEASSALRARARSFSLLSAMASSAAVPATRGHQKGTRVESVVKGRICTGGQLSHLQLCVESTLAVLLVSRSPVVAHKAPVTVSPTPAVGDVQHVLFSILRHRPACVGSEGWLPYIPQRLAVLHVCIPASYSTPPLQTSRNAPD